MSFIEPLEKRSLLSGTLFADAPTGASGPQVNAAVPEAHLSAAEVESILAQAASQALAGQAIVVVDREGVTLGVFGMSATSDPVVLAAAARARTAALFQSRENAFTTRSARFIIQDHFPQPVHSTPGGPLYGVQFSSLPGSDVITPTPLSLNISGDPGGVPLFRDGLPVGGIGVAGDGHDVAARSDLLDLGIPGSNPDNKVFNGHEESDFDEAVALAGATGFMAPGRIRATRIFLDGLRVPFTRNRPARNNPLQSLDDLTSSGAGALLAVPALYKAGTETLDSPSAPYPEATFSGVDGQLKNTNPAAIDFGLIDSDDTSGAVLLPDSQRLLATDVAGIISDAVSRATVLRAAIRKPTGRNAVVHVSVVDRDGTLLGVFRMDDGTNFSFDVSVQKARTAAFFSDDGHAFSTRAVGFVSQRLFPVGIDHTVGGPLFGFQKELSLKLSDTAVQALNTSLPNGITIFPGGVPLYKNGVFVGAVGVSGDGVDQDDAIAFAGAKGFQPSGGIRSDQLPRQEITQFLLQRVDALQDVFNFQTLSPDAHQYAQTRLAKGFKDFRLPYVKFPRNPRA